MINKFQELLKGVDTDISGKWVRVENVQSLIQSVIAECANVSKRTGALNEADFEGEMIADAILEHFGVEE